MTSQFDVVNLNVGGKKFTTYYDTLKQSTYFQELVSNGKASGALLIKNGDQIEYFIDRDGKLFEDILNYLRSMKVSGAGKEHLEKLLNEAIFYKLDDMVIKVQRMLMLDNYEENNNVVLELVDGATGVTAVNVGDHSIQTIGQKDGGTVIAGINYDGEGNKKMSKFVKMTPRTK